MMKKKNMDKKMFGLVTGKYTIFVGIVKASCWNQDRHFIVSKS